MILVCAFFGCLGQAFKRSASTTSMGADENPSQAAHTGDRHRNGDRNHGRAGRSVGHTAGLTVSPPLPAAGGATPAVAVGGPSEVERRITQGGPLGGPTTAPAQTSSPFDGDLLTGGPMVASSAAVAAATQPAMLVKLDRGGGPSRRTPLHVAAERGQLHQLSAIIENLCCTATAALLAEEEEEDAGGGGGGQVDAADGHGGGARSRTATAGGDGSDGGGPRPGTLVLGESRGGAALEGAEEWTAGSRQQHQHRQPGGSGSRRSSGGPHQQQHQQRGSTGRAEDFPIARPGAGGAPLAPDQFIQFHLNMQDADGTTALSLACRCGHVDCCRLLLANGSARTLADARGNTPLHYAALRGHLGVLFMLLDEYVEPGRQEELNGYVDARNQSGCTPLHYAVWGRQSGSVQVLLQHGADVLPRNSRPAQELTPPVMVVGSTPLHLAAARGHVEICRIVLKTFAERVLEPLQLGEDDPQPATLASLDPRVQVNANGHMPYQVAQRLGFYPLAMLLRPSIPILRLFSDEERAVRFYGPAPLRAIAAEALNKKLLAELDVLAAAEVAAPHPLHPPPQQPAAVAAARSSSAALGRQQPGQVTLVTVALAAGGGGGGDVAGGAWRPVSAPATLEQLAAAAAMDAAAEASREGAGAGQSGYRHQQHPQTVAAQEAGAGSVSSTAASGVGGGGLAAGGAAAGTSRRITPPRQLNVEIAVAGGTLDNDGRPSGAARRILVSDPAVAAAAVGAHPSTPRTPPVGSPLGAQLLSPSAVSPRLVSPIALVPPSPSPSTGGTGTGLHGGGGGSPTASVYPQQGSPLRGSSARRSAPPLSSNRSTPLPASNRSSNAVLSAAPIVAALSRPPSAPRANGQPADTSRVPELLSLPGQPDVPEPQLLRLTTGREQAAAGGTEAGGSGVGLHGSDMAGSLSGVGGEAAGGSGGTVAGTVYGPRTPVRQASAGVLHARRLSTSPQAGGTTSAALGTASSSGGASSIGALSSSPRPSATSSFPTAVTGLVSGTAVVLEGSGPSGSGRGNDGGRTPGLVRLRSNPLFEDVHQVGGTVDAAAPVGGGGDGGAVASGMPPLPEDAAEGEEGPAARPAAGGSCVTPFVRRLPGAGGGDGEVGSDAAAARGGGGGGSTADPPASAVSVLYGAPAGSAAAAVAAAAAALGGLGDDDEDLECGVCMEPLPMVGISPCRHQICGPCARRICCLAIQKPSHCPFCRATISAFAAPAPLTSTGA